MLYITYESKNGRLDFNGGSMNRPWRVLEIEGLGLTGKSFNTAAYPASIGQQTLSETIEARTISIQCDVNCICGYYGAGRSPGWEVSKALKVLNEPGNLIIRNGHRTRKIATHCVEAVQGERHGGYSVFAMQFVCDYPYFEDQQNTVIPIYTRENLIGSGIRWYKDENGNEQSQLIGAGKFMLPCTLSRRITEAHVLNIGDVDSEPIIKITMLCATSSGNTGVLKIENKTTTQILELNCNADDGDVIIIDIPERKIYKIRKIDQEQINMIACLHRESFLSDFWLKQGQNMISVQNSVSGSCVVECEFSNKYIEAVIG